MSTITSHFYKLSLGFWFIFIRFGKFFWYFFSMREYEVFFFQKNDRTEAKQALIFIIFSFLTGFNKFKAHHALLHHQLHQLEQRLPKLV